MNVWSHPLASMHRGRAAPAPIDLELIQRLRQSFDRVFLAGERLQDLTFTRLLDKSPELRPLFPDDLAPFKSRFARMLVWLMAHLHEPQKLRIELVDLGKKHLEAGVKAEHYPAMSEAILYAMATISADDWNEELAWDWHQTFDLMIHHMLRAYPSHR
jgi:nitric oxide dioxygenase